MRQTEMRDGEEVCEWLRFAAKTAGENKVAELTGMLITTMRKYVCEPEKIRVARSKIGDLIE